MNFLLDTHIAIWYLSGDEKLPLSARKLIYDLDNQIYFSIVSAWEIEIKHIAHPDKMVCSGSDIATQCELFGFNELLLRRSHIQMLSTLQRNPNTPSHKDPFDKMLIAQAKCENMKLITCDSLLSDYCEDCILYT